MGDMISRKQAIDTLKDLTANGTNRGMICGDDAVHRIEMLPFAQPKIIRCKDCKHHWTHKCMDSMPIERCDLEQTFYDAEVDYCSLAERRSDERSD